jgi:hypothetical protein
MNNLMCLAVCFGLLLAFGCGFSDVVEQNKRANFDACKDQCLASNTTMGVFEQGLGYVRCTCLPTPERCAKADGGT